MNDDGSDWVNSDAWMNTADSSPVSIPPFIPDVDYAIPLRLPYGRVSAVVSPHKVRILENGVLRAQKDYTIAQGDVMSLEQKGDLYVASVQHEGDEFPTPIVYWRPEPDSWQDWGVDDPSATSWWLGWVAMAGFTVAWFVAAIWIVWALAHGGF